MADFLKDKVLTKNTAVVLAAEAASGLGAVFATPLITKQLHKENSRIRHSIAKLIEPHLDQIEKGTSIGHGLHAYDEAQHAGRELTPYKDLPPEKRSERIADTLIDAGIVFGLENGAQIAFAAMLKKATGSTLNPVKTGLAGAAVHLGLIGVSATLLSRPTEWIYHKMAEMLPKITGMGENEARKSARNLTYVVIPSFFSLLTEAVVANTENGHRRK